MKRVNVAIVGMGIGRPNGQAIARNPRGCVAALCDLVPERMDDYAKELPAPVKRYTDYKKLCRDPEIDAVFVGTPNQLHVPSRWRPSGAASTCSSPSRWRTDWPLRASWWRPPRRPASST